MTILFKNKAIAESFLTPPFDQLERIDAAKNFKIGMEGPDELAVWFMSTLARMETLTWKSGTDMGNGVTRYTNGTNGGPIFVYVKDGKIIRITPIDFDDNDAPSWTIKARGKTFTPPRKTTLAAHGMCQKSMVYSKERILYPMKRVDFDPNGERNIQNRGKSEFVRISWDEALDIVSGEIKRCKSVGPGAICVANGSHHQWGNLGHYLSAFNRFWNLIGVTKLVHNPDSWEGWFWGAMHHWGNSMRLGAAESYGTVEDCLKEAEMIVFWSSDPDATYGFEGTQRRAWAKELGIKMVHIDPYMNHTAAHLGGKWISPKPGTDAALAQALCHVWITEDLYDKEFVEKRTTGFDEWKAYVLGETDGTPKTPEWQEGETGVPARDVRALAREWGRKKTYLGAGGWGSRRRRRLSRTDGRAVGPHDDHPRRDAGLRPAGRRTSATCSSARRSISTSISPATPKAACLGRPAVQRQRCQQLPAHAAHRDHELGQAGDSPDVVSRGHHERQGDGLPDRGCLRTGPVLPVRLPVTRARTGRDALQVRQRIFRHDGRVEPLGTDVPAREPEVRRQPVGLVGRRNAALPTSSCRPARCSSAGISANGYNVGAGYVHHMYLDEQSPRDHHCSTSASSRWASPNPITTSSSPSPRSSTSGPCTPKVALRNSTGASACSIHPTWPSTSPGDSS